jgi:hypothetical protein
MGREQETTGGTNEGDAVAHVMTGFSARQLKFGRLIVRPDPLPLVLWPGRGCVAVFSRPHNVDSDSPWRSEVRSSIPMTDILYLNISKAFLNIALLGK